MANSENTSSSSPRPFVSKTGRGASRSQDGCWTCRTKKVKCDEARPVCRRCSRLKLFCDYTPRLRRNARLAKARPLPTVREDVHGDALPPSWMFRGGPGDANAHFPALPIQLPEFASSACSVKLTSTDHEAIRYFRTTFARIHHTKNPDYSLFSIIFSIAECEPMAMYVILALAGQEMEFRRPHPSRRKAPGCMPLQYYSAALHLLAESISGKQGSRELDFDSLCTVLYLMLIYEQKYGEPNGPGVSNHLMGTAHILQTRCHDFPLQIEQLTTTKPTVLLRRSSIDGESGISLYAARMLIWIGLFDAAAATFGLGGHVNTAIHSIYANQGLDVSPVENFGNLHDFTNPLYRNVWGEAYPQAELLDDVENRSIYALLADASQLRYMVAELNKMNNAAAQRQSVVVRRAILKVWRRYREILEVAAELSSSTDNSQRLVNNMRAIVPVYHAVVLEFMRTTQQRTGVVETLVFSAANHVDAIMSLAYQAFRYGSHEALIRVAWPLFVVALITHDEMRRDWILHRFEGMRHFGKNLDRAYKFLKKAAEITPQLRPPIDVREILTRFGEVEMFVI